MVETETTKKAGITATGAQKGDGLKGFKPLHERLREFTSKTQEERRKESAKSFLEMREKIDQAMHQPGKDFAKLLELAREMHYADFTSSWGSTPLMLAAHKGRTDIMGILLDMGADIRFRSQGGSTALNYAADCGGAREYRSYNIEAIKLLVGLGADVDTRDSGVNMCDGSTPLMQVAYPGNLEAVKFLIEKGADIDAKDKHGMTALMLAAQHGQSDVVEFLIEKGADVNAKDYAGKTALRHARGAEEAHHFLCQGRIDAMRILREHGARE